MTRRVESGDQRGLANWCSPGVRSFGAAEPSAGTTKMCWGRSTTQPSPFSRAKNRVMRRGGCFFGSSES